MRHSNTVTMKAVKSILRKWRPLLGLDGRWSIGITIYNEDDESWPHGDAVAACLPSPGYYQASLAVNGPRCLKDAHSLDHILVHELVHIVLWPLTVLAKEALGEKHEETWRMMIEAPTEQIARALLRKNEVGK